MMAAVGIDLGTTNSCVAVVSDAQVKILQSDRGKSITPSCVAFRDKKTVVGEAAKYMLREGYLDGNIVYSVKRIIGQNYDEEQVQQQGWPFKVMKDIDGMPTIEVIRSGKTETFRPEEIGALVLHEMKLIACKKLGRDATKEQDAVITVPAKFTMLQRVETEAAANIAGLNVIGTINEPTAAALAYGLSRDHLVQYFPKKQYVLVYDLGGGTFDAVVMEVNGSCFNVVGQAGDLRLGGDDFTNKLAEYFAQVIAGATNETDLSDIHATDKWKKLVNLAEETKKDLSFEPTTKINMSGWTNGKIRDFTIDQEKLNDLNMDLYLKTMKYIKEALKQASVNRKEVQDVVLAGGSTRIPFIKELVKSHFPESNIHDNLDPDEIVAKGAAIYAAQLSGFATWRMAELKHFEKASYALGTDVMGDKTSIIIEKNTPLPAEALRMYTNALDNQTSIQISVCQGEEETFSRNQLIDIFSVPIKRRPAGDTKVEVKFRLDTNRMLSVTAREKRFLAFLAKKEIADINLRGTFRDARVKEQKERLKCIMKEQN